jgi:DNA-binding response OmpR family regulator
MPGDKVLVVDDDPIIRLTLTEALRGWGYEPVEAGSVATALNTLATQRPAALLLDINLPDGSGLDALREIKRRQPQAVVIMITADVLVENTLAALRGGADDFIGKPIDINEVQLALSNGIEAKRQHKGGVAASKPRLLIVSDAADRSGSLRAALDVGEIEIEGVTSTEELDRACAGEHDLAVVDVAPAQLTRVLKILRESPRHSEIAVLVEASRIVVEPDLTSILPKYRAMPCSRAELIALARRRIASITTRWRAKRSPVSS